MKKKNTEIKKTDYEVREKINSLMPHFSVSLTSSFPKRRKPDLQNLVVLLKVKQVFVTKLGLGI